MSRPWASNSAMTPAGAAVKRPASGIAEHRGLGPAGNRLRVERQGRLGQSGDPQDGQVEGRIEEHNRGVVGATRPPRSGCGIPATTWALVTTSPGADHESRALLDLPAPVPDDLDRRRTGHVHGGVDGGRAGQAPPGRPRPEPAGRRQAGNPRRRGSPAPGRTPTGAPGSTSSRERMIVELAIDELRLEIGAVDQGAGHQPDGEQGGDHGDDHARGPNRRSRACPGGRALEEIDPD